MTLFFLLLFARQKSWKNSLLFVSSFPPSLDQTYFNQTSDLVPPWNSLQLHGSVASTWPDMVSSSLGASNLTSRWDWKEQVTSCSWRISHSPSFLPPSKWWDAQESVSRPLLYPYFSREFHRSSWFKDYMLESYTKMPSSHLHVSILLSKLLPPWKVFFCSLLQVYPFSKRNYNSQSGSALVCPLPKLGSFLTFSLSNSTSTYRSILSPLTLKHIQNPTASQDFLPLMPLTKPLSLALTMAVVSEMISLQPS